MGCKTENSAETRKDTGRFPLVASIAAETQPGVFPVDKPEGVSSFRMVQIVRRLLGVKKVGHTGTLDPFASGVLVICSGRPATRLISQLMAGDKEYEATLQLGVTTDTLDIEGKVMERHQVPEMNAGIIAGCLARFRGVQMQTPPPYSALKHKGKPLYYYARKGISIVKEPRQVEIKELECVAHNAETLTIRVVCSKGTYIRTLAADIGSFLGCGAHLSMLKRTRNGFFTLGQSLPGEELISGEAGRRLLDSHHISVDRVRELLVGNREEN